MVVNILLKSLTASPLPDFNLCISLLDERPLTSNLDEPDPLPSILPLIQDLYTLLYRCRFPAFWQLYRSQRLEALRDNYTVECVGFEDSIRQVVVRAVKAAFTRIGSSRLSSYLDLTGITFLSPGVKSIISFWQVPNSKNMSTDVAGLLMLLVLSSFLATPTTKLSLLLSKKTSS